VAELADAPDLGSGGATRAGSIPVTRISKKPLKIQHFSGVSLLYPEDSWNFCVLFDLKIDWSKSLKRTQKDTESGLPDQKSGASLAMLHSLLGSIFVLSSTRSHKSIT